MPNIKKLFASIYKKENVRKAMKPIVRFLTVFMVMAMIFAAIGVAYVWYMGQNSAFVEEDNDTVQSSTNQKSIEPTKQAENVPVSAAVQFLSSPVVAGENVSIYIKTKPASTCGIVVEYDEIPSVDSGLIDKVADKYGMVNWSWTVEEAAPTGKWPVTVTCVQDESSAVVVGDLVVE